MKVSPERRTQLRKAWKKYNRKMLGLGFKGGRSPQTYFNCLQYQKAWGKLNRPKTAAARRRYLKKVKIAIGTSSPHAEHLYATSKAPEKALKRKLRMKEAIAEQAMIDRKKRK